MMSVKTVLKSNWLQKLKRRFLLCTRSFTCMRSAFPHAAMSYDEFQIFCLPVQRCYGTTCFFGFLAFS